MSFRHDVILLILLQTYKQIVQPRLNVTLLPTAKVTI